MNKKTKVFLLGVLFCFSTQRMMGEWWNTAISCVALCFAVKAWFANRAPRYLTVGNKVESTDSFAARLLDTAMKASDLRYVQRTEWAEAKQSYDKQLLNLRNLIEGNIVLNDQNYIDPQSSGLRLLVGDLCNKYGALRVAVDQHIQLPFGQVHTNYLPIDPTR